MPSCGLADLERYIRTIPDYPNCGVYFRDITTLVGHSAAFQYAIEELVRPWVGLNISQVAGVEARGFIPGGAIAHRLSAGFVPIRKKGKLPYKTVAAAYSLEYGVDEIEMHADSLAVGDRVILVDDLIATGGTAEAAVKLVRSLGAELVGACFIVDLPDLGGSSRLEKMGVVVHTLVRFNGH